MIYILIPTRNRAKLLGECLDCIKKQTYKNHHTIVVDDGSTDDTSEVLKKFKKLTTIQGNGNLWWTGAMRLAVEKAKSMAKTGDYVLLMNDDTKFKKDYLERLIEVASSVDNRLRPHPLRTWLSPNPLLRGEGVIRRAIITSVCLDIENPKNVLEAGVKLDWTKPRVDIPLKMPKDKKTTIWEVDTACGRGTLVPIEAFQKLGNFSKWLPHYKADYEFLARAKQNGFPIYISSKCIVYATHKAGGIKFIPRRTSIGEFWQQAFSRRSKSNLWDQFIFIWLAAPNRYKAKALILHLKEILFRIKHIRI
jgi:GT2 family glycosyltransferase